jgi:hypothetical protein
MLHPASFELAITLGTARQPTEKWRLLNIRKKKAWLTRSASLPRHKLKVVPQCIGK